MIRLGKKDASPEEKERLNFLFRFLKENGVYHKYKKNINDKKIQNNYQYEYPNNSLIDCGNDNGFENLITMLFVWDKTKEGYDFWYDIHTLFKKQYTEEFGGQELCRKVI